MEDQAFVLPDLVLHFANELIEGFLSIGGADRLGDLLKRFFKSVLVVMLAGSSGGSLNYVLAAVLLGHSLDSKSDWVG
ncbi:hypothetical protein AAD018_017325 [Aestuariibius insulae]|uniref:hypothetical protein n=1 Tax=Aestuariibius insulae TaxID=2058287 RepID=UPI00345EC0D3